MTSIPEDWGSIERETYYELVGYEPELIEDVHLQMLFDAALFDKELDGETREAMMDDLIDYLDDEYDIDFEADFDWESYREWYG